jgi:hypothetical protein
MERAERGRKVNVYNERIPSRVIREFQPNLESIISNSSPERIVVPDQARDKVLLRA